jgi:hypothetical protein
MECCDARRLPRERAPARVAPAGQLPGPCQRAPSRFNLPVWHLREPGAHTGQVALAPSQAAGSPEPRPQRKRLACVEEHRPFRIRAA